MRILHISTRLILGGSQENTVLSCEGQARLGHEVHLAFGPIYGPEGSLLARVEAFNRRCASGEEMATNGAACGPIKTHTVPHLIREIRPLTDLACRRELRDLIRTLRPDIVHTHSSKAGILGRAAAWKERVGVVHTIHGPPFHQYQSRLLHRLYVASERYAAKRCHMVVSVADAMTRLYLAQKIGRAEQYVTVYSGMEIEPFLHAPAAERRATRESLGIAESDFVVGTVARLAELKGHDDLLDALANDLKVHANWKLLWVGDGWWRERLYKRIDELNLRNQVITTGLVPPERIPALIRAMDVLAHPSYREGLPRTVPQALLAGVCPVAYDVDGTGEVCRDGETGKLVKPGDRHGLREAILWLGAQPREREQMAARGREWCRERFSAERMVADLEKVYERATTAAHGQQR